jgi:hypothetical protein
VNSVEIKKRIERLSRHADARTVFGAAHHAWRVAPPLSPEQLADFEEGRRVTLPASYRQWLLEVGSSGAGPGNGLFEPGTWSLGRKPDSKWTAKQFGPLGSPFPYSVATEPHQGPLPGAMPLCDFGCGIVGVLVTAGAERGHIWIDHRKESADGGLVPEDGLDFEGWVGAWLAEAERRVDHPEPPRPRAERTCEVLAAKSIVPEAELIALRDRTLARLRENPIAIVGRLGQFRFQGNRVQFSQGPAVTAALKGAPLPEVARAAPPEVNTLAKLFVALLAAPVWTEIEVPGLLTARVWQEERSSYRDYLGRTKWLGYEGRLLAIDTRDAKL